MINALIFTAAVGLLFTLLYFARLERVAEGLCAKAALSCLFVVTALTQAHPVPSYYHAVIVGLILCAGGDVFLALPQRNMFLAGLVCFLVGHVCYLVGFLTILHMSWAAWLGGIVFIVISTRVYFWLEPHLQSMKVPVILYISVITLMAGGAWSILCDPQLPRTCRLLIFFGALLFYLSDIFVARNRFVKKEFLNRLLGLPLYYTGQFLLAFSVSAL